MFTIANEPKIVADTRQHILTEFSNIKFQEEGHVYTIDGTTPESVSTVAHRFIAEPFDDEKQAVSYAARHGKTPEHWLQQWRQNSFRATTLGTKTHEFGESLAYLRAGHPEMICESVRRQYLEEYGYLAPIHPKEEAVVKFLDGMPDSMHLVLNEAKVCSGRNPVAERNLEELLCGTFDMLYYYDGSDGNGTPGFVVLDYKTNSQLTNDYNKRFRRMLLPPFDDMVEQPLSLYSIQLSLYALMLEDIGIPVIDRRLVWLTDEGPEIISVPDVSERLRKVL